MIRPVRILLLGGTGQVGWELRRTLAPLGEVHAPERDALDLRNLEAVRESVRRVGPDLVVNAAAYNDVDGAVRETELAHRVNAEAPRILAEEAERIGASLVHYSTDYVFGGDKDGPYDEEDTPRPENEYGRSKRKGELAVADAGAPHFIFRLSWVYGGRRHSNFVETMLRLFEEREEVEVVDDRWGSPTWCRTPAEVTAQVLAAVSAGGRSVADGLREQGGLYHLAARGSVSRYEQARAVQRHAQRLSPGSRLAECELRPIPSSEYAAEASRPRSTALSSDRLARAFGLTLPRWEQDLVRCLEDRFLPNRA